MIIDSPRPISGSALVAAGVTGIIRYIAKQGGSSVVVGVTAAEVADLEAHGVQLALVYEAQSATWMGGGAAAGTQAANWVQSQLNAIGQPNAPVYFAADSNTLDSNTVNACLDAIAAVLGHARVGEYGFAPQLTSGHGGNHAQRYWLCGSASGIQAWQNLYQQNNTAPVVAGQSVDADTPEQADWGQIGANEVELNTSYTDWAGNPQTVQSTYDHLDQKLTQLVKALLSLQPSRVPGSKVTLSAVDAMLNADMYGYTVATQVGAEASTLTAIQSAESAANTSAGTAVAALKSELDALAAAVGKLPTSIPGLSDAQVASVSSAVSAAVVSAVTANTSASPAQIAQAVLEALGAVLPKAA